MFTRALGEIIALGAVAGWTVSALAFETAAKRIGSVPVNTIRMVIAAFILILINAFRGLPPWPAGISRSAGVLLAFGGALGQSGGMIFAKLGMRGIDAMSATFIRTLGGIAGFLALVLLTGAAARIMAGLRNTPAMLRISIGALAGPVLGVSAVLASMNHSPAGFVSAIIAVIPVVIILPSIHRNDGSAVLNRVESLHSYGKTFGKSLKDFGKPMSRRLVDVELSPFHGRDASSGHSEFLTECFPAHPQAPAIVPEGLDGRIIGAHLPVPVRLSNSDVLFPVIEDPDIPIVFSQEIQQFGRNRLAGNFNTGHFHDCLHNIPQSSAYSRLKSSNMQPTGNSSDSETLSSWCPVN